jgi:hypothetical protein
MTPLRHLSSTPNPTIPVQKETAPDVFRIIPTVGPRLAEVFMELDYADIDALRGENPQDMYDRLISQRGEHVDRCVLYVFRLAVYYAAGGRDPQRLRWWDWKDTP